MAKKMTGKRLIAMVLTLVMLLNGFHISARADETAAPEMVENFQDTYYKQDGTASSAEDWEIHLSKNATPTETDNVFEITLKIQLKDTTVQLGGATHGAVTLVLDVSNSMNNMNGRKTQLGHLKTAVNAFLDEYVKSAKSGDKRMVSVAVFGTNAVTIQHWVDVTDAGKLAALKTKINSLSTGNGAYLGNEYLCRGGTNMEAGLVLGRNLLKQTDKLAGIPDGNRSLILFSDGEPTARVKDVNDTSVSKVVYGGTDTGKSTNYSDYDDIGRILSGVSATKIAVRYNYEDSYGILKTPPFTRVIASTADTLVVDLTGEAGKVINVETDANTVIDPMGTGVTMLDAPANYNAEKQMWDLSQLTPTVENGITTYIITYRVELDPEAVAADPNYPGYTVLTPANGATVLNYTVGEDATPVSADFNEPNIRGVRAFTVSYEYEGFVPAGAPEVPASATYKAGENVTVAAEPTLENYTFSGWDTDDFVMPAQDVVIRGSWTENPKYDYSLTYNANFGENETKADSENITGTYKVTYGIGVDVNTFVRENYTFVGWNTESDGSGTPYTAGETVLLTAENNTEILYAQWDENDKHSYSLIYNANFGMYETKADSENKMGVYETTCEITVDENTFVRENYTFIGWNTEPDGSGTPYTAEDVVTLTAENNTEILYAQWKENPKYDYSLTYNANFGENETKADSENATGIYEEAYEITVDENTFVRENYTFIGWNTEADGSGIGYTAGDALALTAENNTEILYAQWEENPKYDYSLFYNANFGENEMKSDAENVTEVYDVTFSITVDANSFVRENYTFIGWNTEADGSGIGYTAGDALALTAENNTEILYAQWEENPTYDYSLIYNANFGENETLADSENVTGIYEELYNIAVDENVFVREGYTFIGWNTEADGSGIAYEVEELVVLTALENTEILYAQWEQNPPPETEPPVTEPPVTEPPVTEPPVTEPPVTEPPVTEPPVTEPPVTEPEEEIEIPDEEVPLTDNPKTGDPVFIFVGTAFASAAGMIGMTLGKKKEEIEE